MQKYLWIFMLLMPLAVPGFLEAHGMDVSVAEGRAVVITAAYDDGEAMSYSEVKIHAPGEAKIEYQNGRTDNNGCFAFVPDRPGQWRIMVDGGMGHMVSTDFAVNEALTVEPGLSGSQPYSRMQGLVTGLSIIFGLTGFIFYFRSEKFRSEPKPAVKP
ncbi:MAG: hypothetical protein ABIK15_09235 [Pseudomonadota bacterium]